MQTRPSFDGVGGRGGQHGHSGMHGPGVAGSTGRYSLTSLFPRAICSIRSTLLRRLVISLRQLSVRQSLPRGARRRTGPSISRSGSPSEGRQGWLSLLRPVREVICTFWDTGFHRLEHGATTPPLKMRPFGRLHNSITKNQPAARELHIPESNFMLSNKHVPGDRTYQCIPLLVVSPVEDDSLELNRILSTNAGLLPACVEWSVSWHAMPLDAIAEISTRRIPIVLSECDLAPASWRILLEQFLRLSEPPLLIVTSRLADEWLWAEALNLGAWDVLAKPLDVQEVCRTVKTAWLRWCDQAGERTTSPASRHARLPKHSLSPKCATRIGHGGLSAFLASCAREQ